MIRPRSPLLAALSAALVLATSAWSATDPATEAAAAVVGRLHAELLATDQHLHGADLERRTAAFAALVDETHDLDFMARLSLGPAWDLLAEAQRRQFAAAFRRLSILGYATRFEDTPGASFHRMEQRLATGGRVAVTTELRLTGEPAIRLDYVLHATPSGWRIVNIVAEGVSELALQRTQYQRAYNAGGFEALMRHVERRIAELESG